MALEKIKITGVSFYDDKGPDGKDIKSGKAYVEESLDFTKGRAKGTATNPYQLGKPELIKALMNFEFPLIVDAEIIRVTDGKQSKNVINKITPPPASAAPPAR